MAVAARTDGESAAHAPVDIDFLTWNETHGNGFLARR